MQPQKDNIIIFMATNNTTSTGSAWTELEFSARCMSPYISSPIYIPEETSYFLCRPDGTREQHRLTFVVFRTDNAADDEWEDDPTIGRLQMAVLGDDDEEVKPAEAVYLGVSPDRFVKVVRNDENEIVFDFTWHYGNVEIDKAVRTDEGYVCCARTISAKTASPAASFHAKATPLPFVSPSRMWDSA